MYVIHRKDMNIFGKNSNKLQNNYFKENGIKPYMSQFCQLTV